MTATNINIGQLIDILVEMKSSGVELMDLDMLPDDNHPSMNKLVLHPNKTGNENDRPIRQDKTNNITIRDPRISPSGNDIFDAFSGLV